MVSATSASLRLQSCTFSLHFHPFWALPLFIGLAESNYACRLGDFAIVFGSSALFCPVFTINIKAQKMSFPGSLTSPWLEFCWSWQQLLTALEQESSGFHKAKYLSECASDENKGFYNSYFWGFLMSSNILGSVIAAYLTKRGVRQSTLFILFAIMAILGSLLFCFLRAPQQGEPHVDNDQAQDLNPSFVTSSASI